MADTGPRTAGTPKVVLAGRRYLCSPRIPLALAQIVGQPLPGRLQDIFEPSMSPLPAVCQHMPPLPFFHLLRRWERGVIQVRPKCMWRAHLPSACRPGWAC